MILLAPTLAASRYLDKTEQWSRLPPETKDHAVDLIQKGSSAGREGVGRPLRVTGTPGSWWEEGGTQQEWGAWPRAQIAAAAPLQGYMRIQQFRKADGSYGAWLSRASSTW